MFFGVPPTPARCAAGFVSACASNPEAHFDESPKPCPTCYQSRPRNTSHSTRRREAGRSRAGALLRAVVDEKLRDSEVPAALAFGAGRTEEIECMRITSSGRVRVGAATPSCALPFAGLASVARQGKPSFYFVYWGGSLAARVRRGWRRGARLQ